MGRSNPFFNVGFHGDRYLLNLVDELLQDCRYFVEIGTNVGSTLCYVANKYSYLTCFSCEPNNKSFVEALNNIKNLNLKNISIFNFESIMFLNILRGAFKGCEDKVLFWLGTHGSNFKWALKDELELIIHNFKSAYILIDDFKVPGLDCFKYGSYKDQECSMEYIKDSLNTNNKYAIQYPTYTERTSKHHPLVGWILIKY